VGHMIGCWCWVRCRMPSCFGCRGVGLVRCGDLRDRVAGVWSAVVW